MHTTRCFGNKGEETVCQWLQKEGYSIIARNHQMRLGEVDIIATKEDVVAFIEVKTRHIDYFPISQTVTFRKQQRIIKAARHFILINGLRDKVFRFDVATVIYNNTPIVEYIPNAFQVR
jgi:putative endonuclease